MSEPSGVIPVKNGGTGGAQHNGGGNGNGGGGGPSGYVGLFNLLTSTLTLGTQNPAVAAATGGTTTASTATTTQVNL